MEYIWELKDLNKIEKKNIKVFTCFSCGGGSTMGYKLAGCDVIGNVEIDPKIMEVYKKNHNPKYSYLMGVQEFKNIPNEILPQELFDLDILDGSPPCSTFSISGSREKAWGVEKKFKEGQAKQVLSDLFFDFLDVVEKLKPKVVVAENVKGMIMGNAKGYVKAVIDRFDELGYKVQLFLLNGAFMGVPQKRERIFFVASKKELNFPDLKINFNETPITYGEVRKTLKEIYGKEATAKAKSMWVKCKKGKSFSTTNKKGNHFNSFKVSDNKVLNTITAGGGNFYDHEKPFLISNEALIKCGSFPTDYNFLNQDARYLIGMSVPPLMTAKLTKEIIKQFFKR